MDTILKSIAELKQGDKVAFYGATMLVIKDAYISKNFDKPTYIAKCELIDNGHADNITLDTLRNYGHFQGTDKVNLLTIKNQ